MPTLSLRHAPLALALLALTPAQAAADATITGKVRGAKGYTINGTSTDGRAVSQRLGSSGAFKLRFRGSAARGATLQLIRRDGRYLGPVVLARRGRSAFVALSGRSVRLGTIRIRSGYATPLRAAPAGARSRSAVAADRRGKPVGAGKLGLVRRSGVRASQSQGDGGSGGSGPGAGADPDRDGIPSAHDADDDGDLRLDAVDSGGNSSSAGLFSTLFLRFDEALNANAGATGAQIDSVFESPDRFNMIFYFDSARTGATAGHVNCFALVYCRRGDGTAILGGVSESSPDLPRGGRWVDYSPDGSGHPNLERIASRDALVAGIQPRVTTAQIRPGDTYNVVFRTSRGPVTQPVSLSAYFVTTPAVTSYSSGGGTTEVSYPVQPGSAGSDSEPIQMSSERLTLSFWRPQRAAISGAEGGAFTDMGRLHYGVVPGGEGITREPSCAGHYTDLSPTLTAEPSTGVSPEEGAKLFPLVDAAADASPNPSRKLSFTVDVGACLRAAGMDSSGRTVRLTLTAASESRPGGQDRAAQTIAVRLP